MHAASTAERARLVGVLAGMGDAVLVVDERGKTVPTNTAYDNMLKMLGGQLIPADEHGFPLAEEQTLVYRASRGEEFRQDFTARASDGLRYWFDATGRPLESDEAGAGVVVIRDITDRSVRRLQEEFLQWAGHELRTPLAALQSFLQLAAKATDMDGDPTLREHLAAAIDQTRRLATLIDELLDASRLKSGRIMLRTEPVDLVPMVEHVVDVARVLAKGQTIHIDSASKPLVVAGDRARLEQVLLNLLLNAINHAPDTDRIDVQLQRKKNEVELSVQDGGPGIDSSQLEDIFERFSRREPEARPGTSGLGLGLYIAREIVQAHRGKIAVDSVPGEGATFTITLPLLP